jgi:hypothetical protein
LPAISILCQHGDVIEIRALHVGAPNVTVSGYFEREVQAGIPGRLTVKDGLARR